MRGGTLNQGTKGSPTCMKFKLRKVSPGWSRAFVGSGADGKSAASDNVIPTLITDWVTLVVLGRGEEGTVDNAFSHRLGGFWPPWLTFVPDSNAFFEL